MAEQFLRGYAISLEKLRAIPGCKRSAVLRRALDTEPELIEELDQLLSEWGEGITSKQALEEIVEGKLVREHAYEYRRMLELLAELVGRSLEPVEVTLPGRGWQRLTEVFPRIGLPRLGRLWGKNNLPFPWRRASVSARKEAPSTGRVRARKPASNAVDWPIATVVPANGIALLLEELRSFGPKQLIGAALNKQLGEESVTDLISLLAGISSWLRTTSRSRGKALLLLLDGQQ